MDTYKKNYFKLDSKLFLVFLVSILVRLIPLRVPNIEPIMAGVMPISRAYGALISFLFAILSVLIYDVLTFTFGLNTFFTVVAYGVIGLWSATYFKNREGSISNYVRFAVIGTLFFDAFTGLTIGPIFFNQSFLGTIIGQIPFTALHLLGNVTLAIILSPALYRFLIKKKKRKTISDIISNLNPKTI